MSEGTTSKGSTAKSGTQTHYPWFNAYPKNVNWAKPYDPRPLYDLFDQAAIKFPNHICTNFLGAKRTYQDLSDAINRTATGLMKIGIQKGNKVGLLMPNCPTYIIFYFAALKIGAIVVNNNPLYTEEELEFQIKNSETKCLVTLDLALMFDKAKNLLEKGVYESLIYADFAAQLPGLKSTLFRLFKGRTRAKTTGLDPAKYIKAESLLESAPLAQPVAIDPVNDIAVLQYTGGTTGRPKGAMLTHANLYINTMQAADWSPDLVAGQEKFMAILPFFHVFGMTVVMNLGLYWGSEIILVPKFELKSGVKLIKQTGPTAMPGVPTLFNALINSKASAATFKSLKICLSGGAPLPKEIKQDFEAMAECEMFEGYGLSETSPILTCNPVGDGAITGSIGLPVPGTILSIRSLEDPSKEVPLGERGEICAAGPQIMKGYWNAPEETNKTMVGDFLRTGDAGTMDENGFTYIVDRLKDLIICSGFNVYPRKIEDAIYELFEVEEVTVIGIANEYRGEAPKAFIKLKKGQKLTANQVMAHLKEKLSKIELPEEIEFRDELPKTMIGKLSKKELRAG